MSDQDRHARWAPVIELLPPCLRDPKLMDSLWAIDAQMRIDKASGAFYIEAHYSHGSFRLVRVKPPHIDFVDISEDVAVISKTT